MSREQGFGASRMPTRKAITVEQRRELRAWARNQHPKATQKACIEWFEKQFGNRVNQCTISESLSPRYASLDDLDPDDRKAKAQKSRPARWPEVETLLFAFQKRVEGRLGLTSDLTLQLQAKKIWAATPGNEDVPSPPFGLGWLARFRARFGIKQHTRHGEESSVPESANEDMETVRVIAEGYEARDIYNMDETGLYWRMTPSRGLSTQSVPGIKKDKTRITLTFCCNSTGDDRFPLWIIGNAKVPRSLRNVNVRGMGAIWKWNRKAWMNTDIMEEWYQAFYLHIGTTRRVLLTMDNFSAHASALR